MKTITKHYIDGGLVESHGSEVMDIIKPTNGQVIARVTLADESDGATGEAYCLAHHVTVDGGKRRLMLASLRYLDTFVKLDGAWLFSERLLYVDWLEERALS